MKRSLILLTLVALLGSGCSLPYQPTLEEEQRAQAYIDKGVIALRQGDLADAQAAFVMAHSIAGNAPAKDGLGCVELLKGNVKEAEDLFLEAYSADPRYSDALGHLALVREIQKDAAGAKELYERELAKNPESFRTRNNYAALISEESPELARAELYRAKATAKHPTILENIDTLEEEVALKP